MESLPRLGATAEGGEIGAALDRAGCCVIDRVVAPEVMDAIVTDLEPYAIDGAFGVGEFEGRRTRRTGAVVLRSPTHRSIVRHPAVVAAGDQPIEVEVNALWVVTDFPERNGATRVIPGSHRFASELRPDASTNTLPAEMSKGSLLLYLGRTYHAGGRNESDEVRIGLSLQHSVGWVSRGEQFFLECTPEVVADWADELVRFLRYQMCGDSLGVYLDSLGPMAAVHPERDDAPGRVVSGGGQLT